MNHICAGTKSSSRTEMEGKSSRLELSHPMQQTQTYLLTGSKSATYEQTSLRGQGHFYRGMDLQHKIPRHI